MKAMKATGYQALISRYSLQVAPPFCSSWIHSKSERITRQNSNRQEEYYPPRYDPGEGWQAELSFALRHEGIELGILSAFFRAIDTKELVAWIGSSPTGKYVRIVWFLYEWMTGHQLPIPDLTQGNYVPVLDPEQYYCLDGIRIKRQRVVNNLLGTPSWCPIVRRSSLLAKYAALDLKARAAICLKSYPEELLTRASMYLYTQETKTSFALEHLEPDTKRSAIFISLLRQAGFKSYLSQEALVSLQNAIVDPRYANTGWRTDQNYIGQSLGPSREIIHYVPPRPEDLPDLMEGWNEACARIIESDIDPVVAAAIEGFSFVFLHPFDDGNGRIHRFLIHHVLARRGFTPPGLIFPVSAAMLRQRRRYDECLEIFSRDFMPWIEWVLDERGAMTVKNNTAAFYRYPDLTPQAEALYSFVEDTINRELIAELDFLVAYDRARRRMVSVVDLPGRQADLFVRLCLQGKGKLSKSKRNQFPELSDDEIAQLESIVYEEISSKTEEKEE